MMHSSSAETTRKRDREEEGSRDGERGRDREGKDEDGKGHKRQGGDSEQPVQQPVQQHVLQQCPGGSASEKEQLWYKV